MFTLAEIIDQVSSSPSAQHEVCIQNTGQAITVILATLVSGSGALTVVIKSFFDVQNARLIAELQGEIKAKDIERSHVLADNEEKARKIAELIAEVDELHELRNSGFSSQLSILQKENEEWRAKYKNLVNMVKKNQNKPH